MAWSDLDIIKLFVNNELKQVIRRQGEIMFFQGCEFVVLGSMGNIY